MVDEVAPQAGHVGALLVRVRVRGRVRGRVRVRSTVRVRVRVRVPSSKRSRCQMSMYLRWRVCGTPNSFASSALNSVSYCTG